MRRTDLLSQDGPQSEIQKNLTRVLHVNDDPECQDSVASGLEEISDQLVVIRACNMREGSAMIDDVDCVLSAQELPVDKGITFLKTVREERPDLPFILYSAEHTESDIRDALSAGVTDYLDRKPCEQRYELLATRIQMVVDRYHLQQKLDLREQKLHDLVQIVAHDIRNPLQVATAHLDVAEQTKKDEAFTRVRKAHQRIEELLENVLSLSQYGTTTRTTEHIKVSAAVQEALAEIGAEQLTLSSTGDCWLYADQSRLKYLFENLLRNATEHAQSDVIVQFGPIHPIATSTREGERDTIGFYIESAHFEIDGELEEGISETGYTTTTNEAGYTIATVAQIADAHNWQLSITTDSSNVIRFEFKTKSR